MRRTDEIIPTDWRRAFIVGVALTCLIPGVSVSGAIRLLADETGATACILPNPPVAGLISVYVFVDGTYDSFTWAHFKVTAPTCSSYELVGFEPAFGFLSFGEPQAGVAVGLAGCRRGGFILRLDYVKVSEPTSDCCGVWLVPHPDAVTGQVETLDCASVAYAVEPQAIWFRGDESCTPMPAPSDPYPPDGATNVPLTVTLNCTLHDDEAVFTSCLPLHGDGVNVYFGTDPDPPLATPQGQFPMPRTLSPGTTYHWRVEHWNGPAHGLSPRWSFTTANATPVETSTWGAIKALYR